MGDSHGRWEGDTLVVDATNFCDNTWFDVVGNFHSSALHIVERFTVVDPEGLTFQRVKQPGYELMEWACHEGERDVQHIEIAKGGK